MNNRKPQQWKECKLGDVAEVQTGPFGSQLHQSDYKAIGTPIITVEHLGDNRIIHANLPLVGDADKDRLKKYTLKTGDVVFSRVGSVDRCAFVHKEEDGWMFSGRLLRVRAKEEVVDSRFLSFYFSQETFKDTIRMIAVGATMPSINTEILSTVEIPLPPLPEQRAIAGVLSSLDDKIDLLHRQNKTLEEMAESLWRKMFMEEAEETWKTAAVKDLINILSGFAFKSADFVDTGKYRLITIKNVQDGYLDLSRTDYLGVIPAGMPDYCFLQNGDILLSLTGNVGRCCLVNEENLLLNQRVAKLQARNVRDSAFTYIMFRQKTMRIILEELAKGTAQANLSPVETANYETQIPPDALLEKYSEEATPLIEKVLSNFNQIRTITRLRDTLLTKLMSGEVRVRI